jgi:hypothetical protein
MTGTAHGLSREFLLGHTTSSSRVDFLFMDQPYTVLGVSSTTKESRSPKVVLPSLRRNEVWFYLCNRLSTKPPDYNPSLLWNDIVVCVVMLLRMETVFIRSNHRNRCDFQLKLQCNQMARDLPRDCEEVHMPGTRH